MWLSVDEAAPLSATFSRFFNAVVDKGFAKDFFCVLDSQSKELCALEGSHPAIESTVIGDPVGVARYSTLSYVVVTGNVY